MARSGSRNLGERWVWNTPSLFANEPAKALAGAMNRRVNTEHSHVEHVYWIGRIFRGVGYAGEAASPVMESGFSGPGLHRRYARHLAWKRYRPHVLAGIGCEHEGTMHGHILKGDRSRTESSIVPGPTNTTRST